jgi:hypothetical protein
VFQTLLSKKLRKTPKREAGNVVRVREDPIGIFIRFCQL